MTATHGHGEKFSRRKEVAIAALLEHASLQEAAASCGLSERTLRRWLTNEEFQEQYRAERDRLLETAQNLLRAKSVEAVEVLVSVSNDQASPSAVRVSAARSIISLGIAGEILDVENRLTELEEIARNK
jgi:hypothetical protein